MSEIEQKRVEATESLRESIKSTIRDSIDQAVNEKAKEKGYTEEERDGDGEEKDEDEDDEDDSQIDEALQTLEEEYPDTYNEIMDSLAMTDTESGDVNDLTEASRRKAAAIGAAIGALATPGAAAIGAPVGAAVGAAFAKGKQRTLQDQIDRMREKLRTWQNAPETDQSKIDSAKEKLRKWEAELSYLKQTKKGDSGIFRSSYAKSQKNK